MDNLPDTEHNGTVGKPAKHFLGLLMAILGISFASSVLAWTASDSYVSNTQFIGTGSYPQGIVVDDTGNVYVCDSKVDKYTADGTFIKSFGPSGPTDLAFDLDGNLLIVDYNNDRVEKWDTDGNYIATYFSTGAGDNNLSFPWQIAVDSQGNVYVAEYDNNRIHKFNSSMAHVGYITGNGGAFNNPEGVAVDGDDSVIVMDSGNDRMQKFDSTGNFIWSITGANGGFNYSEAIRADSEGNIYVADSGNNRVQIYDSDGNFVQQFGTTGSGLGQFNYPMGLGITADGTLYVGDANDVQKFRFDRTVPSVSITALAGNTTTDTTPSISGTITDSLTALTAIEYSIDSGAYVSCAASDGTVDELSEEFVCTIGTSLSIGSHTIKVRGTDSKTNTNSGGNVGSYTFTVTTEGSQSTSSTNNDTGTNSTQGYQQIPASDNGNEVGGVLTPSGNSNTGGQEVVVIIEADTFNYGGYLSVVEQPSGNFTSNLSGHPESNIVQSGGSIIGITTESGEVAWQVGGIQEIYYKAYPPENSNLTPAIILPEVQNKPSILSMGYNTNDLINPGSSTPYSQNSLLLAFSPDGYHWRLIESSIHDFINKTLSVVKKIGGYYMIVSVNRNALAIAPETEIADIQEGSPDPSSLTEQKENTPEKVNQPQQTTRPAIEKTSPALSIDTRIIMVVILGVIGVALIGAGLGYLRKP